MGMRMRMEREGKRGKGILSPYFHVLLSSSFSFSPFHILGRALANRGCLPKVHAKNSLFFSELLLSAERKERETENGPSSSLSHSLSLSFSLSPLSHSLSLSFSLSPLSHSLSHSLSLFSLILFHFHHPSHIHKHTHANTQQDKLAIEITSIQMESEQHIRKIRSDASLSAEEISSKVASQKQTASSRVSSLTERINAEIAEYDAAFEESTRLLVSAYEKYLSEMDEASRFLPMTVTVTIPSRKITLKAISIRPTDTLTELKSKVEERLRALGDPLCDLGSDTKFYLIPLFGGAEREEKEEKEKEKRKEKEKKKERKEGKKEKREEKEGGRVLLKEGMAIILSCNPPPPQGQRQFTLNLSLLTHLLWELILTHDALTHSHAVQRFMHTSAYAHTHISHAYLSLPAGSTIEIVGSLSFESDKPKTCFSQMPFVKGESEMLLLWCYLSSLFFSSLLFSLLSSPFSISYLLLSFLSSFTPYFSKASVTITPVRTAS